MLSLHVLPEGVELIHVPKSLLPIELNLYGLLQAVKIFLQLYGENNLMPLGNLQPVIWLLIPREEMKFELLRVEWIGKFLSIPGCLTIFKEVAFSPLSSTFNEQLLAWSQRFKRPCDYFPCLLWSFSTDLGKLCNMKDLIGS